MSARIMVVEDEEVLSEVFRDFLTELGHQPVMVRSAEAALTRLEGDLSRALRGLEPNLRGCGFSVSNLVPGFMLRTRARNALRAVLAAR